MINHQKNSEGEDKLMKNLFFLMVADTVSQQPLHYFAEKKRKQKVFLLRKNLVSVCLVGSISFRKFSNKILCKICLQVI